MFLAATSLLQSGPAETADTEKPYLDPTKLPPGAMILPPPPRPGSPAATLDAQVFLDSRAIKQQNPARWAWVTRDAIPDSGGMPAAFACALGVAMDRATAPNLHRLLDRTARTLVPAIQDAQRHYRRKRPYLHNHQPICLPRFTQLDHSPSYPSASAALDWSAALILAELAPDRAGAILARGREIGENRAVCGVDWLSDVQAATLDAAALVAVLHANPDFRADLQQARQEVLSVRKAASPPDPAACALERAAKPIPLPSQL